MDTLKAVDGVEVLILIDNTTDNLSSVPSFVETEFAALERRRHRLWVSGGKCLCCAAFGLSCLITVRQGGAAKTLLFDTGPEDRTFEQNVSRLGANLESVEAIVLSHGHWDHGGAMLRALQLIRDRNGGQNLPCYVHPDMFRTVDQRMRLGMRCRLANCGRASHTSGAAVCQQVTFEIRGRHLRRPPIFLPRKLVCLI
jgi:7,8-dihydropterin-6-yl-methyl-4-(beta-D-ribofuranosyl)aminobenzene 5'-phosphate synthase